MKFRTEIEIPQSSTPLDYSSRILSLGSCFATAVAARLLESKFSVCVNPVGVLFNPLSICSTLQRFAANRRVESSELRQNNDLWYHFDFHSSLSSLSADEALSKMNDAVELGHSELSKADTVIITLGTAWVYYLSQSGEVVASCHKEPSNSFTRRMMSAEEVYKVIKQQVELYPAKRFIFSVSPIRHIADGLTDNSLSKATLRLAVARVVESCENALYFPSYEIMMDDLRDYRFYAEDMLHPSSVAIDYIWFKFSVSQISLSAQITMKRVSEIVRAASHKPFNAQSDAHKKFCQSQIEKIKELPDIDFGKENEYFMSQLQNNL